MERRNVPDTGGPARSVLLRARPGAVPQRLAHPRREAWAASPHFVSGAGFPAHLKDQVCPSETSAALGAQSRSGGRRAFSFCGWTRTAPTLEARASGDAQPLWRVEKEDQESGFGWLPGARCDASTEGDSCLLSGPQSSLITKP